MLANPGGSRSASCYQLSIVPQSRSVSLFGRPFANNVAGQSEKPQTLYGCCGSVEELIDLLGKCLGLPSVQLEVIFRVASEGKRQVVGGQDGTRIFERAELEQLGLELSPTGLFKRPTH
jgi:hypothetical protein